ncbi:MAG: hypothetical protein WBF88_11270 [Pusillimonas sp.]
MLTGDAVTLSARLGSVGLSGSALRTDTDTLDITSGGSIVVDNQATLDKLAIVSSHADSSVNNNSYQIKSTGLTFNLTDSSSGYYLNTIAQDGLDFLFTGDRKLFVGTVNTGGTGSVALESTTGDLARSGSSLITGDMVTLTAASGDITLNTAAKTLKARARNIDISQNGAVTLAGLSGIQGEGQARVTATAGNITIGADSVLDAGTGSLKLNAQAGSIFSNGGSLRGKSIDLAARDHLGAAANHLATVTSGLAVSSGGDIYLDNTEKVLANLAISNTHYVRPEGSNAIQITSPYLGFDVEDDGEVYRLKQIYSASLVDTYLGDSSLPALSFTGDRGLELGSIKADGQVSLTATSGNIGNDGNPNTRVTGGSIDLTASQGSIGAAGNAIQTDTGSLTLNSGGNLHVDNLGSLWWLDISHGHAVAPTGANTLQVRASGLAFDVEDNVESGYHLNEVRSNNALTLSFGGDRSITIGDVDAGRDGYVTLKAGGSGSSILDDGDKDTSLLAGSVILWADKDVGLAGEDKHLDVRTSWLGARASSGGVHIQVLGSAATNNYTNTIGLDGGYDDNYNPIPQAIYAGGGSVEIDVLTGDLLQHGDIAATGDVTLKVQDGSLGLDDYAGSDVGISAGQNGTVTLVAENGNIGTADKAMALEGGAVSVKAQAGGDIHLRSGDYASGNITLADIEAGGDFNYQQSYGTTLLGAIESGGAISITGSGLRDDGDADTRLAGASIALSSGGAIGMDQQAIGLDSSDVSLTGSGSIYVDNAQAFQRLDIKQNYGYNAVYQIEGADGQSFGIASSGNQTALSEIRSDSDLDFGFTSQSGDIVVGVIDAGDNGAVRLASSGNISSDKSEDHLITAMTVALTAGQSIGSGIIEDEDNVENGAIRLSGTESLALTTGRDIYVDSATALKSLSITSTNASISPSSASKFGISADGQTYAITDNGGTYNIDEVSGAGLENFSFTGKKNIVVDEITVTGTASLATSGGGVNSSITSKSGSSNRITADTVNLSAIGTDSSSITSMAGAIGYLGGALRLDTSNLKLESNGSVYIDNNSSTLGSVDLYLSRRDGWNGSITAPVNNKYSFVNLGSGQSLTINDVSGGSQTVTALLGDGDLAINTDAGIRVGTIHTGTGSVSLTTRYHYDPYGGTTPTITSGGTIVAGKISLDASGSGGSIGQFGSAISTVTTDLTLASSGGIYVNNNAELTDLSLRTNSSASITSTGLTVAIAAGAPAGGLTITNVTAANDLRLSIASGSNLTVDNIQTGSGGSVTLDTTGTIYGTSIEANAPDIITGDLTLNARSVQGRYNYYTTPVSLYTSVDTLSSNVSSSLRVSNDKTLTLLENSAGTSASVITTAGSILQRGDGRYTTPVLELQAAESIGADGNAVLTDTRQLSTKTGKDLYLDNASDLFSLNIESRHDSADGNTLQVGAAGLDLDIEVIDSAYHINRLSDASGIDFTLSTDADIKVGTLDAGAGRNISLKTTGAATSIGNIDGSAHISGGSLSLWANQNTGTAGDVIQTSVRKLNLRAGGDMAVNNDLDLSDLTLEITSATASSDRHYEIGASNLEFELGQDDTGAILVDKVIDTTGLNFNLVSSQLDQRIGQIDVTQQGSVTLTGSQGSLIGEAGNSITAGSVNLQTTSDDGSDAIGGALALNLSTPKLSITNSGSVNLASDTHLDSLSLSNRGNDARTYAITSVDRDGGNDWAFSASDDGSGLVLHDIKDTTGMALSVSTNRGITVGDIDLGGLDNVSLNTTSGNISDDGDDDTLVHAAKLSMGASSGAIGAAGNAIDVKAGSVSAYSYGSGNGVHLALNDHTVLNGITSYGDSSISNTVGDIALGNINLNGNGLSVDNRGGSILSGTLNNIRDLTLKAAGSIGNDSAISALYGTGGDTIVLNAEAGANDRGALGSIALTTDYGLRAESVIADGDITLTTGGTQSHQLAIGKVESAHGDVSLTATSGNITAIDSENSIKGNSVSLSAKFGSGRSIGSSGTHLNVDAPSLTIATPGSFYIDNAAQMSDLRILRESTGTAASSGTMSLTGAGDFDFQASDSGNVSTLTNLTDTSGLNFEYSAIGGIRVGQIDLGANGSVTLSTNVNTNIARSIVNIDDNSLITAGYLKVSTGGGISNYNPNIDLNTKVGRVEASTGSNGDITLVQDGTLTLNKISSGGNLSVTATAGDLLVAGGQLQAGYGKNLTLDAQTGWILSEGGTAATSGSGAMTLSAAQGIGTEDDALRISTSGGAVSATVTGDGSLYLGHTGNLYGGLTTSVKNGATVVDSTSGITLAGMTSTTDSEGNDITVRSNGTITVTGAIEAGAEHGKVALTASGGNIIADNNNAAVSAYGIDLAGGRIGGDGLYSNGVSLGATGRDVKATALSGAIYLKSLGDSTYTALSGYGINVDAQGKLDLVQADSRNYNVTVTNSGDDAGLTIGAINAGTGQVSLSTSGAILDDGDAATRITAGTIGLTAGTGIGGAEHAVQTNTANLSAATTGAGDIYLDDNRSAGITLANVSAKNGAIEIKTAGNTTATSVQSLTDDTGNDIAINTGGSLTIDAISAQSKGNVSLTAAGAITGTQRTILTDPHHVQAHTLTASAGNGIGTVTDPQYLDSTPLYVDVAAIDRLASSAANSFISVNNLNTGKLTLASGAITLGESGSAYLSTAGDLDIQAGLNAGDTASHLWMQSGGTITIDALGLATSGTLTLSGAEDIVSNFGDGRALDINAGTLNFRSGSKGGDTVLHTNTANLDARLTGEDEAALTVYHGGDVLNAHLLTRNGDIMVETRSLLNALSVEAGGDTRTINLKSNEDDIQIGEIDAGVTGKVVLHARNGALRMGEESVLTADELDLLSQSGIGSEENRFNTTARVVAAEVTGTGGIYLAGNHVYGLGLGQITTADGDIDITAANDLFGDGGLSAGNGGNIRLRSETGFVALNHDLDLDGGSSVEIDAHTDVYVNGSINLTGADGADLDITGTAVNLLGAVHTDGAQNYHADNTLLLGSLTAGESITFDGDLALYGSVCRCLLSTTASSDAYSITSTGGDISIGGALDGGGQAATLTANAGDVTISGDADNLASLTIGAENIALASVTTGSFGGQYYTGHTTLSGDYDAGDYGDFWVDGRTTLAGDISVTANNGHVGFEGKVEGGHNLDIVASGIGGTISFYDDIGSADSRLGALSATAARTDIRADVHAASVDTSGIVRTYGGRIDTTGAQTYNGQLQIAGNTTLAGTDIALNQGAAVWTPVAPTFTIMDADAAPSLAISGDVAIAGDIGAADRALASFSVDGGTTLRGVNVYTSGAQNYDGALKLQGDITLSGSDITLTQGAVVDAPIYARMLLVPPSGASLAISGNADITGDIGAADKALTSFSVSGASMLRGNHIYTTGYQSYGGAVTLAGNQAMTSNDGSISFNDTVSGGRDLAVQANGGYVWFNGAVGDDDTGRLGSLTLATAYGATFNDTVHAASLNADGNVVVAGGSVDTTGAQTYNGQLQVQHDATLTGTSITLEQGAVVHTPAPGFMAMDVDAAPSLAINGNADITGGIGEAERAFSAFSVSGTTALRDGDVHTTGAQTYSGHVALGSDTTLNGSLITFAAGADSAMDEGEHASLTINGDANLNGAIGANQALDSLTVTGASTLGSGSVATIGNQNYEGAVTLAGNQTLSNTADDGTIYFGDTLSGGHDLTIQAGSGEAWFNGAVGDDDTGRLGNLTLATANGATFNGTVHAASLLADDTVSVAGGLVDTTAAQTYNEQLRLLDDATLTGTDITLKQGAAVAIMYARMADPVSAFLAIDGNADITGDIGTSEEALTTFSVSGASMLRGGHIHTIGGQSYTGAVTLAGDQSMTASIGDINFHDTLSGGHDLTVQADAGAAFFGGAVGDDDANRLGDLVLSTANGATFDGAVHAASLVVDGAAIAAGGRIDTTGAQIYNGQLQLKNDTILDGTDIALNQGAVVWAPLAPTFTIMDADAAPALTIAGNADIGGDIGAADQALASFSVSGSTALHGNHVYTVGDQYYGGAVTLDGHQFMTTATGDITFDSTVAGGGSNLTLVSTSGDATFNGAVGAETLDEDIMGRAPSPRLGNLAVTTGGTTTFGDEVYAGSVTISQVDGGGNVVISGGLIDTGAEGIQTYEGHVSLANDTTLTALTVSLEGGVDGMEGLGAPALTINGGATLGTVGAAHALASLDANGQTTTLTGTGVYTVGAQSYGRRLRLSADQTLNSDSGDIIFNGIVFNGVAPNSPFDLTVASNTGNVVFSEEVGGTDSHIGALSIQTAGTTTFVSDVYASSVVVDNGESPIGNVLINGGTIETTGAQTYGSHVALGGDTILTGSLVAFAAGVDSAMDEGEHAALTINGNASLTGDIGASQALAMLVIDGSSTLHGGEIRSVGDQSYLGAVTLAGSQSMTTDDGSIYFSDTLSGGHDLTVEAGNGHAWFGGALGDSDAGRLGSLTLDTAYGSTFYDTVHAASLQADGDVSVAGGLVDTTGAQTYRGQLKLLGDATLAGTDITLKQGAVIGAPIYARMLYAPPPTAASLTIDGNADITGDIGTDDEALTAFSVTGTTVLRDSDVHTIGTQTYGGHVALGSDTTLNGSLVTFASGADSAMDAGRHAALTINGNADLTGAIGAAQALASLIVNGASTLGAGSIATVGNQIYGGTTALAGNQMLSSSAGDIRFNDTLAGGHDLAVKADSGAALFNGAAGDKGKGRLGNLTLATAKGATFNGTVHAKSLQADGATVVAGGLIDTTGTQTYNGRLQVRHDATLAGTDITLKQGAAVAAPMLTLMATAPEAPSLTIKGKADIAGNIGSASQALGAFNVSGASTLHGARVYTTGQQTYGGHIALDGDTTLNGSLITLLNGVDSAMSDGRHAALIINGDTSLTGRIGANQALASLAVNGKAALKAGSIATVGNQYYGGTVTLAGNQSMTTSTGNIRYGDAVTGPYKLALASDSGNVSFEGAVGEDASRRLGDLTVTTAGTTRFGDVVYAKSVTVGDGAAPSGAIRIDGGLIDTLGAQSLGGPVTLGGDTLLTGATITLAHGVDSAAGGNAALTLNGDAHLAGDIGAKRALASLAAQGKTTLGAGSVTTLGGQDYQGPVTVTGDQSLRSLQDSIVFAGALDGIQLANLSLHAADAINVQGPATGLGDLTLRASNTIIFNDALSAYRIQQLESASSTYHGPVTALGESGLEMTGGSFVFDGDVTARNGAIVLDNDAAGSVKFAQNAAIHAASGFTQQGGGTLQLPASLQVDRGPILITALASLPSGAASIQTDGAITIAGLYGPDTRLTMASGGGAQTIGLDSLDARYKINVAELIVPNAGSAAMYGTVAGYTNGQAAQHITSELVGHPYYINDTPWGQVTSDIINRIVSSTVPQTVIPSTPGADSLFRGTVTPEGVGPDALAPYTDPQVLTVAQLDSTLLLGTSDSDENDQSGDTGQSDDKSND